MKSILVVDDNPETLVCFEEILGRAGHRVITCNNSRSALILIHEGIRADLVIIDYRMPGMNGLELVVDLKNIAPHIPLIMCSAHLRADVYSKAMKLGVKEFVQKPISMPDLVRVVSETLEEPQLQLNSTPAAEMTE